jgi:hypothetical protein
MTKIIEVDEPNGTWSIITNDEKNTIVFALEEYAHVLEAEHSYQSKNKVLELIWKVSALFKGAGNA